MPPSEEEYPIGSFVEDYVYDPDTVSNVRLILNDFDRLQTEVPQNILASVELDSGWILNENNAIKCNTPEYPYELYPDGFGFMLPTEVVGTQHSHILLVRRLKTSDLSLRMPTG